MRVIQYWKNSLYMKKYWLNSAWKNFYMICKANSTWIKLLWLCNTNSTLIKLSYDLVRLKIILQGKWNIYCVKSVQIRIFFWSLFSCTRTAYTKIRTRKKSVFGHFSRNNSVKIISIQFFGLSSLKFQNWKKKFLGYFPVKKHLPSGIL